MQLTRRDSGLTLYHVDPYDIISMLLETLSYGMFLVLFLVSFVLLLQRRRTFLHDNTTTDRAKRSVSFYLITGVLMFLVITAKWIFWWAEALPIPDMIGVAAQLPRRSRTTYRFKEACIQITVLLGDAITIYRLWVLSSENKIMIIFPVVGLFGYLACAIGLSGPANDTTQQPLPIVNGRIGLTGWDVAAVITTTCVTVYIAAMMTWIITRAQSHARTHFLGHRLRQALVILIESAAIYTIWNLAYLIAGLGFHSKIALTFLDCMSEIYGISVMLINVRVGLGWTRNGERAAVSLPGTNKRREGTRRGNHVILVHPVGKS